MATKLQNPRISAKPYRLQVVGAARELDGDKLPAFAQPFARKYRHLFVKDVLRVDKWHTDAGVWDVTRPVLLSVAKGHAAYLDAGNSPINLTYDHSDSARDVCGDVCLAFTTNGDTELCLLIGTNNDDAAERLAAGMPVSIQATPDAQDGKGNRYPILLTHVALCQRPVVTNQRPAVKLLSRRNPLMKLSSTVRRWLGGTPWNLAKEDKPGGDGEPAADGGESVAAVGSGDDSATSMEVTEIVQLLNEVYDAGLSESITTAGELKRHLETLDNQAEDDGAPSGDDGVVNMDEIAGAHHGGSYSQQQGKAYELAVKNLSRQVSELVSENKSMAKRLSKAESDLKRRKDDEANDAAEAWKLSLDELAGAGKIDAGTRTELEAIGKTTNYNLSLLKPFGLVKPTINMNHRTRSLANGNPQPVPTSEPVKPTFTPEESKTLGDKFFGGDGAGKGSILNKT